MDDEMAGDFEGGGKICSASCTTDSDCPTDVPEGAANPEISCALQDQDTGDSYCGMMCGLFGGDCATGQTCSDAIQGVCVWPGETTGKQFSVVKKELKAKAIDCTKATCQSQCECSLDKCADAIDACLAVDNCAASQDCALQCACSDNACMLKCAASSPSIKALPVAKCVNTQCGSALKAKAIDCTKATCQSQCECSLDKCADAIDACLAVDNCAASQDCALQCPCSDNACMLKCAASSPSVKALPVAKCVNTQCGSAL